MLDASTGHGNNPYTVNFISYCGHGVINEHNDALCVIPIKPKDSEEGIIKYVNLDEWARKFSNKINTINIFLFSACRSPLKEEEEKKSSKMVVRSKCGEGISVVIYGSGEGSPAKEFLESGGECVTKFF